MRILQTAMAPTFIEILSSAPKLLVACGYYTCDLTFQYCNEIIPGQEHKKQCQQCLIICDNAEEWDKCVKHCPVYAYKRSIISNNPNIRIGDGLCAGWYLSIFLGLLIIPLFIYCLYKNRQKITVWLNKMVCQCSNQLKNGGSSRGGPPTPSQSLLNGHTGTISVPEENRIERPETLPGVQRQQEDNNWAETVPVQETMR